ncbi:MAG: InlB B-repeat-containing protein [Prevotellaceae bacterium]|jgi:uncharacterized repeat protein (TIGR02543 family)|nr:InlB B-repeat-containing protein [Prevotellaceae bacterium]
MKRVKSAFSVKAAIRQFAIIALAAVFSGVMLMSCDKDETQIYTVTFDAKGGAPAPAEQKIESGKKLAKPKDPALANHEFTGWATADNAASSLWDFESGTITANITLYARWKADEKPASSLIVGKFKSQTGNGDAVFYADYASDTKSGTVVKSSATEKELAGKIEDGDIIFNLSGVYDTETGKFFLSAGSGILIFSIAGTLIDGVMSSTEATVKVKSGDDWTVHTVAVTAAGDGGISIDGTVSDSQEDGLPAAWFGNWKMINEEGEPEYYTLTAWQCINLEMPDEPAGFLDIVPLVGGGLEMIWDMYVHYADVDDKGIYNEWTVKEFCKIWMEQSGQNLLVTVFEDSMNESYAVAKAYDTAIADAESRYGVIFTRP